MAAGVTTAALAGCVTDAGRSEATPTPTPEPCEVDREPPADRGYRVELRTAFYYNEERDSGAVTADSPEYGVVYLVADDRLLRAVAEGYDAEPDLEDAETVECW